jgi:multiple sugar transport system substrate-binding protein
MIRDSARKWAISRRKLLQTSAGAAALAGLGLPGLARGAEGPWSERPASDVDQLNFVVWTYGDIYSKIAAQFEQDWGVPVDSTISSFNDHPTKLVTMFAGGETIDVSQSSPFSFPNFIEQGLVEPLDDLPGIEDYVADFTPFTSQVAQYDGQTMGLPYFSAIWIWNYYEDLMAQAGLDAPSAPMTS